MKTLTKYLNEKLIIFPSQVDEKSGIFPLQVDEKLVIFPLQVDEKLIINKDYKDAKIVVKSFDELRKIIKDRYKKLGPGTEQNPINFNDIDVSNIDSFCNDKGIGLFSRTKFKYIDISDWNVSNVTNMAYMFFNCEKLESIVDISSWDVSSAYNTSNMFCNCKKNKVSCRYIKMECIECN